MLGGLAGTAHAQNTPQPRRVVAFNELLLDLGLGVRFGESAPLTQNLGAYPGTLDSTTLFAFDAGFRGGINIAVGDIFGTGRPALIQPMGRFSFSTGGGDLVLNGIRTGHATTTQFDLMAGAQLRVPVADHGLLENFEVPRTVAMGVRYTPTTDVYVGVLGGGSFIGASGGPFPAVRFQEGGFAPAVRGIVGIQTPIYISPNVPVLLGLEYQVQYTGGVNLGSNFAGERFHLNGRVSHAAMATMSIDLNQLVGFRHAFGSPPPP